MIELLTPNDTVILFASITGVAALALIIFELMNFLPTLMLNILNRMRNKTLAHEADSLTAMEIRNSLEPSLETDFGKKTLEESDLFKRFNSQ